LLAVILVLFGLLGAVSCGSTSPSSPAVTHPAGTTAPAVSAAVKIKDFAYSPATIEVAIGATVTWTNEDSIIHTVTSRTGVFDSGSMSRGSNFSHTFVEAGNFEYYCIPHPSMVGHVIVK